MAILHTPRSIAAVARGMLKRRRALAAATTSTSTTDNNTASEFVGILPKIVDSESSKDDDNRSHHVYKGRLNVLWDADYLGHMNNASYLNHAEYARWEWTAENGALQTMYRQGMHFVVTNTAIRFRREISLRERDFQIHSCLHSIDGDRHLWMQQTFRSPPDPKNNHDEGRILAQVLVQAVAVQNRKIVPPVTVLETIGVSEDVVNSLLWKEEEHNETAGDINDENEGMSFLQRFKELDEAFRTEAAADDDRLRSFPQGEQKG